MQYVLLIAALCLREVSATVGDPFVLLYSNIQAENIPYCTAGHVVRWNATYVYSEIFAASGSAFCSNGTHYSTPVSKEELSDNEGYKQLTILCEYTIENDVTIATLEILQDFGLESVPWTAVAEGSTTLTVNVNIFNKTCDDGFLCTGVESCELDADTNISQCVSSGDPCAYNTVCGKAACNETLGDCVFVPDNSQCSSNEFCWSVCLFLGGKEVTFYPGYCSTDCNQNGRADETEMIIDPTSDSNNNGVLDTCEEPEEQAPHNHIERIPDAVWIVFFLIFGVLIVLVFLPPTSNVFWAIWTLLF